MTKLKVDCPKCVKELSSVGPKESSLFNAVIKQFKQYNPEAWSCYTHEKQGELVCAAISSAAGGAGAVAAGLKVAKALGKNTAQKTIAKTDAYIDKDLARSEKAINSINRKDSFIESITEAELPENVTGSSFQKKAGKPGRILLDSEHIDDVVKGDKSSTELLGTITHEAGHIATNNRVIKSVKDPKRFNPIIASGRKIQYQTVNNKPKTAYSHYSRSDELDVRLKELNVLKQGGEKKLYNITKKEALFFANKELKDLKRARNSRNIKFSVGRATINLGKGRTIAIDTKAAKAAGLSEKEFVRKVIEQRISRVQSIKARIN